MSERSERTIVTVSERSERTIVMVSERSERTIVTAIPVSAASRGASEAPEVPR